MEGVQRIGFARGGTGCDQPTLVVESERLVWQNLRTGWAAVGDHYLTKIKGELVLKAVPEKSSTHWNLIGSGRKWVETGEE